MVPIQPVNLLRFLAVSQVKVPPNLTQYFYLSWEDAVWELLEYYQIPSGAVAVVPTFFCGDVIQNMQSHGLIIKTYPVDRSFQTDPQVFKKIIHQYKPDVVVIFHAVGITNKLFSSVESWLPDLKSTAVLIEDSVHRIVEPHKIKILTDRHVVLDSLRKVVPLQGSNLYGKNLHLKVSIKKYFQTMSYRIKVMWLWLLFQASLLMVLLPAGRKWQQFWNRAAEIFMLRGYDVIGDNKTGASGSKLHYFLSTHINTNKIKKLKAKQVKLYKHLLEKTLQHSFYFEIEFPTSDYGELRGYPLGIETKHAEKIINLFRNKGLLFRFELNDSQWSQQQKIIYLPLGPHVTEKDIIVVSTIVNATPAEIG